MTSLWGDAASTLQITMCGQKAYNVIKAVGFGMKLAVEQPSSLFGEGDPNAFPGQVLLCPLGRAE